MEELRADIPGADGQTLVRDSLDEKPGTTFKQSVSGFFPGRSRRVTQPGHSRKVAIGTLGLVVLPAILIVNFYEAFAVGSWVTSVLTLGVTVLIWRVKRHYTKVDWQLRRLDEILKDIPTPESDVPATVEPKASTAVLMVKEYNGFGIHSLLSIPRLFPGVFRNIVFLSVVDVDTTKLKGTQELDVLQTKRKEDLQKYVKLANQLGFGSAYRIASGADVIEETEKLSGQIAKEYPRSIFFAGKLVFERDRWYRRILHNETAYAIQRRLQFDALNCMVLPVRVFAGQKA